jgi:hypothetical protein
MIRAMEARDHQRVLELHALMGADYALDLARPDLIVKNVVVEDDRPVMAVLGRLTTEAYLILDHAWGTPQDRMDELRRIIYVSAAEAKLYGIQDVHVWVPPRKRCFSRRLRRMGFVDANWDCLVAGL